MTLAGCQIIPIYLNFHLQICLEIFDKNSADKIQSKNYKGGKYALPHGNDIGNTCVLTFYAKN